ncbi:MAG: carbohydrate ABC transporter permease [Chloroflexi bacterium]|nr:carbohydrate ABC transporter permease [Chloroflexota bacterium]
MSSPAIQQTATAAATQAAARRRSMGNSVFLHAVVITLGIVFAFPFYWMVITSLKHPSELDMIPPTLIPYTFQPQNYVQALLQPSKFFPLFAWNTLVYTVLGIIGRLFSNTLAAYGFARIPFKGRNFWFVLLLSTLMIPYEVLLIPQFLIFKQFGWLDSILPLVVPQFFGSAFYIFLLRQFFLTIPRELDEAAVIDGANQFDIFVRIMLPLSRPILITVFALSFVNFWNDFFGPLIYLNTQSKMVMSVALRLFIVPGTETPMHLLMAASVVSVIPVIVVFLFAQRAFIQGVVMSGLKG